MNKSAAFDLAFQMAMIKAASYLTEEDRLERKIDRHMQRGYGPEKKRLMAKGQGQGRWGGAAVGGTFGGLLGYGAGSDTGQHLAGAALGAIGGGLIGRWVGGKAGRAGGREEARAREELARKLRTMAPDARRKHIEHIIASGRAASATDAQQRMADAAEEANWISMHKDAAFGQQAAEGTVRTVGGVAKKLVGGKWVDHTPAAGGGFLAAAKKMLTGASGPSSSAPIVKSVNVAKARMAKAAGCDDLLWVKEGKNRLARAIDAARSGAGSAGNTLRAANRVAGLTSIQEATKPAAGAMAGRFKDVADTIKARPGLKPAALSLLREKRI